MTDPTRHAADVRLLILTRSPAPDAAALQRQAEAAGLAGLTVLPEAEVIAALPAPAPDLRADRDARFRAAAPAAIAAALTQLRDGAMLLVEIADDMPALPGAAGIAALLDAAQGARGGFIHGQALFWPQEHHVGSDCLVLLDADTPDMQQAPFVWPSPSVYARNPSCLSFLHLWGEYATDPRLALARPDSLRPSSNLLRGHEMSWAIGSILAHRAGAAHFAPAAEGDPPPAVEAAFADARLSLADAGRWLGEADGGPHLVATRAAVRPRPQLLVRQLGQMLSSAGGRICRDHIQALMAQTAAEDMIHAALLDKRFRDSDALWTSLCAEINLIWTERQLDGVTTALPDMPAITREALRRALERMDRMAVVFQSNLVWKLLGPGGRDKFRGIHGPSGSSSGRAAMRRFVDSLDQPFRGALIEASPGELRDVLAPELRQRLEAWLLVSG